LACSLKPLCGFGEGPHEQEEADQYSNVKKIQHLNHSFSSLAGASGHPTCGFKDRLDASSICSPSTHRAYEERPEEVIEKA
jgi:hypothetical protein